MTGQTFDGRLNLHVRGRSWTRTQRPPLHVTVLEWPDRLLALATDQSGGQRGGDHLHTEVVVTDGGWLDWLPPSSQLYYPGADRRMPCSQETRLRVEAGSRLAWCPRVSIPCKDARIEQLTQLVVEPGAECLFWDGWADGRTSSGEHWEFESLSSHWELVWAGRTFQERWTVRRGDGGQGLDPAGFQGACQWHLGLAAGELSRQAMADRVQSWRDGGAVAEMGELDPGLWVARALFRRPMGA